MATEYLSPRGNSYIVVEPVRGSGAVALARGGLIRRGLELVPLLLAVALAVAAVSASYTGSQFHYSIDVPAGWVQGTSSPPIDVEFRDPSGADVLIVAVASDSAAANTASYVMEKAQTGLQSYVAQGWTQVAGPTGGTIGGRPDAEFTIKNNVEEDVIVVLSSQYWHLTYILDMGATLATFGSMETTFSSIKNSFTVSGEGGGGPDWGLIAGISVGVVAIVLVIAVFALWSRKARQPKVLWGNPPYVPPQEGGVAPQVSQSPPQYQQALPAYQAPPENLPARTFPVAPANPTPAYPAFAGNPPAIPGPSVPPQTGPDARRSFCINCGAPLAPGSAFCGACGSRLE